MARRLPKLSPQEQRVLTYIGKGYSTPEIAARLGVTNDMARQYVTRVITFVRQRGRLEAGQELVLTGRQEDVATLLRQGFSNRDIASQLGMGVRTVETHVGHILRKLNLRSRTELSTGASGDKSDDYT